MIAEERKQIAALNDKLMRTIETMGTTKAAVRTAVSEGVADAPVEPTPDLGAVQTEEAPTAAPRKRAPKLNPDQELAVNVMIMEAAEALAPAGGGQVKSKDLIAAVLELDPTVPENQVYKLVRDHAGLEKVGRGLYCLA